MKSLKYCENYQNVTQRHEVNKCCWKNGTDIRAGCRVATHLQFVKNTLSVKHNKLKHDKTRCACSNVERATGQELWPLVERGTLSSHCRPAGGKAGEYIPQSHFHLFLSPVIVSHWPNPTRG